MDRAAVEQVRRRPPLVLTVPALAVVCLVVLPLVYLVTRSAGGGGDAWRILGRQGTVELLLRTGLLVGTVTALATLVAVPLAWLVARTDLPGRRAWAVALALPLVIPSYVAALALLGAFGPKGLLQQILEPLGVERLPDIYGFPGAVAALVLSTYPYVYLLASAGLRELDPSLEEVSRSLGRSALSTFSRVTLPMVWPSVGAGALLAALYTLADFGAVSLMQTSSLTRAIFLQYRAAFDRRPAAVLALVLVALTALILLLETLSRRRLRYARATPGVARAPVSVRLGAWRWPALAYCGFVSLAFLAVPIAVLSYWLARGVAAGQEFDPAWLPALNSLIASGLAAAVAIAAAIPIATLAQRYRSRRTVALERLSYSSNALPGIVIALALVFFAANYLPAIYQTLPLLVLAYAIRFFPQAVAGAHSALLTVNPRLEEAARALGRGPLSVVVSITVPLIRSGLAAGAALVFLSTMKELPATLLLRPVGFETLATEVWKFTSLSFYSRAALPALLLIVVSAPLLFLLTRQRETEEGTRLVALENESVQ